MKKRLKKIKAIITAFWITLISFNVGRSIESWYGVPNSEKLYLPVEPPVEPSQTIVNLAQRILPVITFIAGIVSLIMILKEKDEGRKKKRIIIAIIILSILMILIVGISVIARFLNK